MTSIAQTGIWAGVALAIAAAILTLAARPARRYLNAAADRAETYTQTTAANIRGRELDTQEREQKIALREATTPERTEVRRCELAQAAAECQSATQLIDGTAADRVAAEKELIAARLAAEKDALPELVRARRTAPDPATIGHLAAAYQTYCLQCRLQARPVLTWDEWVPNWAAGPAEQ